MAKEHAAIFAELRQLHEQATPGPWRESPSDFEGEYVITGSNEHGGSVLPILGRTHNWPRNYEANARLIALARTALPALLDQLEALQAFHDAWTEHQCGLATGDPKVAHEKKLALMEAQKAVLETRK